MPLLVHYDLFAINRVLPTVPEILSTWFPLRRSEDRGKRQRSEVGDQQSEVVIGRQRAEDEIAGFCEVEHPHSSSLNFYCLILNPQISPLRDILF
ncbi:MAG: hypothetical protein MUO43_11225 [Desulfobacterales bacterium]|nr:hypothetical protein [Desulfobacterales bacterium]